MSEAAAQHPHYYVDVAGLEKVDVYRLLELFGVNSPSIQHTIKKLLVAGQRGHKDAITDVKDCVKSLNRWLEMRAEDEALNAMKPRQPDNIDVYGDARKGDLVELVEDIPLGRGTFAAAGTRGSVLDAGAVSATVSLIDQGGALALRREDFRIIGRRKDGPG